MPKSLIKKYLPEHQKIKQHKHLQWLGNTLHSPNLWYLNKLSMARAVAIGLFSCLLPIPFQMVLAAILAIFWQANIPVSVVLVWITNPLTMPAIFYSTYKVGAIILQTPPLTFEFQLSWDWLSNRLEIIWQPLLLGSFICAIISAIVGYFLTKGLWTFWVKKKWQKRCNINTKENNSKS